MSIYIEDQALSVGEFWALFPCPICGDAPEKSYYDLQTHEETFTCPNKHTHKVTGEEAYQRCLTHLGSPTQ